MSRWMPFAVAVAVRLAVAILFFGSWDVVSALRDAEQLVGGVRPSMLAVPYLPGVQALLWTAGILGFHTALPLTFLYKFFGCLFDALIAAAVGDSRGLRAGLLYALAPVPVLVFAIHGGQWDSISLALFIFAMLWLRRDGALPAAGAGALYVLSVIAKPITVPFAIFLVERRRIVPLAAGMAACGGVYLLVLWAVGDPLRVSTIEKILDYARDGVMHFGLPMGFGVRPNRLLGFVPLLVLVPLYWRGRIDREEAVAVAYAFLLGVSGLAGQYLCWLLPFLLLCNRVRAAAVYGLVAGLYLTIANASIGYDLSSHTARSAFAPLRAAEWLAPAVTNTGIKAALLAILGDIVFPLTCLILAALMLWKRDPASAPPRASLAPLAAALAATAALIAFATLLPRPDLESYRARTREKAAVYAMVTLTPAGIDVGEPSRESPVDAPALAYVWIIAWSVAAWYAVPAAAAINPPARP